MEKGTMPLSNDLAGKVQMGGRRRKRRGGGADENEMIEMKLGEDEANETDYDLLDKISGGRRRRTKRKRSRKTKKGGRKTRRRKTKSRRRRNK